MAMDNDLFKELLEKSFGFLAVRSRSEKEIRDRLWKYLQKKDHPASEIKERVIERLTEMNVIDDKAFAQWLVESRMRYNVKGPQSIRYELKKYGVSESIIDEVLKTYSASDEREKAKALVEKKLLTLREPHPQKQKKKIFDFLARRGFNPQTIYSILGETDIDDRS